MANLACRKDTCSPRSVATLTMTSRFPSAVRMGTACKKRGIKFRKVPRFAKFVEITTFGDKRSNSNSNGSNKGISEKKESSLRRYHKKARTFCFLIQGEQQQQPLFSFAYFMCEH